MLPIIYFLTLREHILSDIPFGFKSSLGPRNVPSLSGRCGWLRYASLQYLYILYILFNIYCLLLFIIVHYCKFLFIHYYSYVHHTSDDDCTYVYYCERLLFRRYTCNVFCAVALV